LIGSDRVGAVDLFTGPGPRLLAGPLPDDELRRLGRVFQEPDGYRALKTALRDTRLLVLGGPPGTGRTCTALALLHELTRGQAPRPAPATALKTCAGDPFPRGYGCVPEPAAGLPGESGLARLCALLTERAAYAVLLATPEPGDCLAQGGRYHPPHTPPDAA